MTSGATCCRTWAMNTLIVSLSVRLHGSLKMKWAPVVPLPEQRRQQKAVSYSPHLTFESVLHYLRRGETWLCMRCLSVTAYLQARLCRVEGSWQIALMMWKLVNSVRQYSRIACLGWNNSVNNAVLIPVPLLWHGNTTSVEIFFVEAPGLRVLCHCVFVSVFFLWTSFLLPQLFCVFKPLLHPLPSVPDPFTSQTSSVPHVLVLLTFV